MDICLQIDKYSKSDLYDIFELKEKDVSQLNIQRKCSNYINEIESNQNIQLKEKLPLVDFLKKAMNKLIVLNNSSTLTHKDFTGDLEKNKTFHGEHFIIKKDPKSKVTSKINPLIRNTIGYVLNINTMFRSNYYNTRSSDFHIELNNNLHNVTALTLQSAEIPDLYYTFSSINKTNEFTIELFDVSSNNADNANVSSDVTIKNQSKHVIKVKDGIYTPQSLMRYLNEYVFNDSSSNTLNRIGAYYDEVTNNKLYDNDTAGYGYDNNHYDESNLIAITATSNINDYNEDTNELQTNEEEVLEEETNEVETNEEAVLEEETSEEETNEVEVLSKEHYNHYQNAIDAIQREISERNDRFNVKPHPHHITLLSVSDEYKEDLISQGRDKKTQSKLYHAVRKFLQFVDRDDIELRLISLSIKFIQLKFVSRKAQEQDPNK